MSTTPSTPSASPLNGLDLDTLMATEADDPPNLAGHDEAPNPVEHLLHALASCLTTSMVAHAAVRGIAIEALESELEGDRDCRRRARASPPDAEAWGRQARQPSVSQSVCPVSGALKLASAPQSVSNSCRWAALENRSQRIPFPFSVDSISTASGSSQPRWRSWPASAASTTRMERFSVAVRQWAWTPGTTHSGS